MTLLAEHHGRVRGVGTSARKSRKRFGGALDPLTRAEVRHEFTRLQERLKTTVIVVTHDIAEALALGSHVGVIDGGALLAYDKPRAIAESNDPRIRAFVAAHPTPREP